MAKQAKKLAFKTTKGIAMYPWLNKADYQFDSNGQFKVNLRVSKEDANELMEQARLAAKETFGAKAANAQLPFKTDEDTGEIVIVTKSKFQPKFVDSTGQLIGANNVPQIYGGSTLKLAGTIYPYTAGGRMGVSLQLAGVQIIELSEGSAAGIAFEAEDGGFVASNDNAANDNFAPVEGGEQSYNF